MVLSGKMTTFVLTNETLCCNRCAAVLRDEKSDTQETGGTVKSGLAGHRAVSQETSVAEDFGIEITAETMVRLEVSDYRHYARPFAE